MRGFSTLTLWAMLGLGIHGASRSVFGDTGLFTPQVRFLDKRKGGGKKQPAKGVCLCRDPMPLTRQERELLASFLPGKAKKRFVRQLKVKYGKL